MLSFIAYLQESGDSHYPYEKTSVEKPRWASKSHGYKVKRPDGGTHSIHIHHYEDSRGHTGYVTFHDDKHEEDDDKKHSATGEHGHSAVKIFSTVKHILAHHAKKNPHLQNYQFASANDEPSRVSLYKRMTKHLGGSTEANSHLHRHYVSTSSLK